MSSACLIDGDGVGRLAHLQGTADSAEMPGWADKDRLADRQGDVRPLRRPISRGAGERAAPVVALNACVGFLYSKEVLAGKEAGSRN